MPISSTTRLDTVGFMRQYHSTVDLSASTEILPDIPTDGLLLYSALTDATTTTGQTITNHGSVSFANDATLGRNVAVFSGSNYLSFPDTGFPTGSNARTLSIWINATSISSYSIGVGYGLNGTNSLVMFGASSDGSLQVSGGGSSAYQDNSKPSVLTTSTWHHIAYTSNSTWETMYIDGVVVGMRPRTRSTTLSAGSIGSYHGIEGFLTGKAAAVRIYNSEVSLSGIKALAGEF